MKTALCFLAASLAFAACPAFAASACYNPAQLEAEQALRLHSELMVITVTCRQGSRGESLPAAYGDFTKRNIRYLHGAEQTMMAYYKTHGSRDGVSQLDRLRTRLANEFGQKAADMSSPVYCAAYRDKVLKLDSAAPGDVENEVQRMEVADRSYERPCGGKETVVARKSR